MRHVIELTAYFCYYGIFINMIRLKQLLEQANAESAKPTTKVTPIRTALSGGIQKIIGFFKSRGSKTEITDIPVSPYLQKYKYDEYKIQSQVEGRIYSYITDTQINNTVGESTNAFIAICRITDNQPDLPNFKRIGYQVIFESDDAFFEYFLMEYYTGNSVTDSLGHWKDAGDSIVQSVNTLEGNPGKLTQPDGFAAAVEKAFPKNRTELRSYEAIRNDLSTLIGLTLNVVTPDSTDRTDYL